LPNHHLQEWKNIERALNVNHFRIPRRLGCSASSVLELHGFSDASQQALGAVVYLRTLDECGSARISLISAKSKVAPLKKVMIPRLELSAAVLLARLIRQIQRAPRLTGIPVHCWIDYRRVHMDQSTSFPIEGIRRELCRLYTGSLTKTFLASRTGI